MINEPKCFGESEDGVARNRPSKQHGGGRSRTTYFIPRQRPSVDYTDLALSYLKDPRQKFEGHFYHPQPLLNPIPNTQQPKPPSEPKVSAVGGWVLGYIAARGMRKEKRG